MGKMIDSDTFMCLAKNIAMLSSESEEGIAKFTESIRFMVELVPEANNEKTQGKETGEWGDIVKIGVSMAYGCKKCGKSVVQPLAKTTYRFCPHCGAENGEREVE